MGKSTWAASGKTAIKTNDTNNAEMDKICRTIIFSLPDLVIMKNPDDRGQSSGLSQPLIPALHERGVVYCKNPMVVGNFIEALIEASTITCAQRERGLAVL
jgi:hypothetical protein